MEFVHLSISKTIKSPNFYPDRFVRSEDEIAKLNNKRSQIDIDIELAKIRDSVTSLSANRYRPFFMAGIAMRTLGLSLDEIEIHLKDIEERSAKQEKTGPNQ